MTQQSFTDSLSDCHWCPPVLRVMLVVLLLKLISKQFKFPGQISVGVVLGGMARGDDDWLQMVRLGSITISVRYRRRDRKHPEQTDLELFINGNIKYSFFTDPKH